MFEPGQQVDFPVRFFSEETASGQVTAASGDLVLIEIDNNAFVVRKIEGDGLTIPPLKNVESLFYLE